MHFRDLEGHHRQAMLWAKQMRDGHTLQIADLRPNDIQANAWVDMYGCEDSPEVIRIWKRHG